MFKLSEYRKIHKNYILLFHLCDESSKANIARQAFKAKIDYFYGEGTFDKKLKEKLEKNPDFEKELEKALNEKYQQEGILDDYEKERKERKRR